MLVLAGLEDNGRELVRGNWGKEENPGGHAGWSSNEEGDSPRDK